MKLQKLAIAFLYIVVFIFPFSVFAQTNGVILDHDGGVDDFIALTFLACDPGTKLKAATIAPADSYKDPATLVTKQVLDHLGAQQITIAASDLEGINLFPAEWREDSVRVFQLPFFKTIKNQPSNSILSKTAPEHLVELLSGSEKFTLVETGPLSNIAEALKIKPEIKKNIERIYIMGGAVRTTGNVEKLGHDQTAEWNIYNNPIAADIVFKSSIPITLVPLDVTNFAPVTTDFVNLLKKQNNRASILASQLYLAIQPMVEKGIYYFWDALTAAAAIKPELLKTEKVRLKVILEGISEGRTIESPDGSLIDVAFKTTKHDVEGTVMKILKNCRFN